MSYGIFPCLVASIKVKRCNVLSSDVAFKVGAATDVKWLVLQVHYKDVHLFTGAGALSVN